MISASRGCLAVLLSVALGGCVATPPPRIGAESRAQFAATEVVANVPQAELEVDWSGNTINNLQTLIGSAFDSDRQMGKDPTQAVASLRGTLGSFNFDKEWLGALDSSLRNNGWLNTQAAVLTKSKTLSEALYRRSSKSPGLLVATSRYSLSPDLSTLRVVTYACVFLHKQAASRDCTGAKYKNGLAYSVRRAKLKSMEENATFWTSDDALRNALQTGITVLAKMVAADIADPSPPPQGAATMLMVQGQSIQALSKTDSTDGITVRYTDGSIGFFATPLK